MKQVMDMDYEPEEDVQEQEEPDPELLEEIAGYFGVSMRELTGCDRR